MAKIGSWARCVCGHRQPERTRCESCSRFWPTPVRKSFGELADERDRADRIRYAIPTSW